MAVAKSDRLVRQIFDKIDYTHISKFKSLKVLHKLCAQYTNIAIFSYAFDDASIWPGNQSETNNYAKKNLINCCCIFFASKP